MTNEEVRNAGASLQGLAPATSRTLHIDVIRYTNACIDQRALFRKIWGEEVTVTPDELAKHAKVFDWYWAAERLLSRTIYENFIETLDKFEVERQAAIQPFIRARDHISNCYDGEGDYSKEYQAAREAVNKVREEWQVKAAEVQARNFAASYISDVEHQIIPDPEGFALRVEDYRHYEDQVIARSKENDDEGDQEATGTSDDNAVPVPSAGEAAASSPALDPRSGSEDVGDNGSPNVAPIDGNAPAADAVPGESVRGEV